MQELHFNVNQKVAVSGQSKPFLTLYAPRDKKQSIRIGVFANLGIHFLGIFECNSLHFFVICIQAAYLGAQPSGSYPTVGFCHV